jgi:hypothetical protein
MTHQHVSSGEEVKDSSQQTSTSAVSASQPTQCCVFFARSEWSRRYGEEFYTARIDSQQQTNGSPYVIAVKCANSEWVVERPYSAFQQVASDIAALYRPQGDYENALPPLPADKADVGDMQTWMDGTLQRKDMSRLTVVRYFLNLDTAIQHTQHEQEDSEDEQQTATEGEAAESKQIAAT